jgi:serine/threonine protein kinase/Flp pilus assembly protein TadD
VDLQLIGRTISHYTILAELGEGGMGAVYRAQDLRLGREVALKFLPVNKAVDPQARKRLLQEAQAASRLNHPNIATIYEVNESEGVPFLAMELVQGQTFKQILQRGAWAPAQFLDIARQVAEGLQEAHSAGVFHRDVKPGNIMLDGKSRVKILAFGLAILEDRGNSNRFGNSTSETEGAFLTRTSTQGNSFAQDNPAEDNTGGTLPYMSPEQLRGEPASARSDIFSFGVLVYECLSGTRPFRGETAVDVLHAILRTPHPPLRSSVHLPNVPQEWEKLIDGCLAKSAEQRYASMGEVLDLLRRIGTPAQQPEKSVAVLYFENLSGAKEDEYFRDGMTEDIITELAKIKDLRLFPRSAVLAFRDKPLPAAQIGQQLAVAYVLDGSIRRAGNRLRITAQLAETRTGHSVWAERYDRQLEDVFEIQDEIARNIACALRVMLTEQEKRAIEKVPTRQVQAYDYYLRGRQIFYQFRRKGLAFARQMFARATVIDPSYASAFAGVADCCSFLYMYWEASEDNLREAVAASRRAVELEPESAEAHASRGLAESLSKNYKAAEKEFDAAIQLNPRLFEACYFYARSCFAQGQMEKAAGLFEKASRLNPADYQSLIHLASCLKAIGRTDEAREASAECLRVVERHVEMYPEDARALYLGAGALVEFGETKRSLEWAARALAIDPEESSILYNVACTYCLLGEKEQALDCLEKAIHNGFGHKEWIENDPDFAALRSHPRFQALLEDLPVRRNKPSV